jgi:hypothetical protein
MSRKEPKKKKSKATIEEVTAYVREKGYQVNPVDFVEHYEEADPPWTDRDGRPVRSWKQKLRTWHNFAMQHVGPRKCSWTGCKLPGVYIAGRDDTGFPCFRCVNHRPVYKPILPKEMTGILNPVPNVEVDINEARNRQMVGLKKGKP